MGQARLTHLRWWERAACLGMDTELFFPVNGDYTAVRPVCESCRVRAECLEDALRQQFDLYGYFGGTTPRDRDEIRMRRMRYDWPGQG